MNVGYQVKLGKFKKNKNGIMCDEFGYPLSPKYRTDLETKEWLMSVDTENRIAVTLTLKKYNDNQYLTKEDCNQNLKHFLNVLNAHYFGNNYKRRDRCLRVVSSLELSANNRLHYHLLLENPKPDNRDDFETKVKRTWWNTNWGYREIDIKPNADKGWTDYITKFKSSSDEIDWGNYNH